MGKNLSLGMIHIPRRCYQQLDSGGIVTSEPAYHKHRRMYRPPSEMPSLGNKFEVDVVDAHYPIFTFKIPVAVSVSSMTGETSIFFEQAVSLDTYRHMMNWYVNNNWVDNHYLYALQSQNRGIAPQYTYDRIFDDNMDIDKEIKSTLLDW